MAVFFHRPMLFSKPQGLVFHSSFIQALPGFCASAGFVSLHRVFCRGITFLFLCLFRHLRGEKQGCSYCSISGFEFRMTKCFVLVRFNGWLHYSSFLIEIWEKDNNQSFIHLFETDLFNLTSNVFSQLWKNTKHSWTISPSN